MGISGAINHDAAVATVHDGEILFAGHSERYSKKKNDPELHQQLINDAIKYSGKPDVIAWYEKPVLKKLRQWSYPLSYPKLAHITSRTRSIQI